ncbi:SRPBCC domain-containing protein [Nocardia sp. NBC_01503]|uniref:SRPBCC domain-containing protein n=1 Tax=Nocardia sp. NBC_01503 TaxID=2975997 RepID=UPI002E7AED41|nr:SRPBCC domain-containing protein [Nocardia sp. NBC_01503]WTL35878.1 SRPBCC domain-containing protein [Nocardia sp. NBC_01503]
MRSISTGIQIDAPPDQVWKVFSDFAAYGEWNPFIREARGTLAVGSRLNLRLYPVSGRPMTFKPVVLVAEPERAVTWKGIVLVPGLFDGTHKFTMRARDGGTYFTQAEDFSGLLTPFLGSTISGTVQSFELLNAALKKRVEQ